MLMGQEQQRDATHLAIYLSIYQDQDGRHMWTANVDLMTSGSSRTEKKKAQDVSRCTAGSSSLAGSPAAAWDVVVWDTRTSVYQLFDQIRMIKCAAIPIGSASLIIGRGGRTALRVP